MTDSKVCRDCGSDKPLEEFYFFATSGYYGSYCKPCTSARSSKRWEENPDPIRRKSRNAWLKRAYGITLEEYEAMFEAQNGVCAACFRPEPKTNSVHGTAWSLCVDHNHETGKVRELLCSDCNKNIGLADESVDRFMALMVYLIRHEDTIAEIDIPAFASKGGEF